MEITKLIADIVRKVELAIIRHETAKSSKRKVLIVSKDLDKSCPDLVKNQNLKDCCDVDSVDNNAQQVNLEGYSKVIVCDLDNDSLSKLTSGIFDNPYLKLIGSCIMQGKDMAIVEDDIEFLQYRDTAPASFLAMFNNKLDTLREWGIEIRSLDDLVCALCGHGDTKDDRHSDVAKTAPAVNAGSIVTKRALTESDVIDANFRHQKEIMVSKDTMVTEVAKEYGRRHGIVITRAR